MKKYLKNKKQSILTILLMFCMISGFISCKSSKVFLPGETEVTVRNIYNEYLSIADTFFSQEKYSDAIKYYKLLLDDKQNYWNIYYKLARCYALQGSWSEASEMYTKILSRDPENSTIKISIAYIYAMNGELDKAKDVYNELIQTYPEDKSYLENYISILLVEKDHKEVSVPLFVLLDQFPDSEKLKSFQSEYDKLVEQYKTEHPEEYETQTVDNEESEENSGSIDDEPTELK